MKHELPEIVDPFTENANKINLTITEDTVIRVNGNVVMEFVAPSPERSVNPIIVLHLLSGEEYVIHDFRTILVRDKAGELVPYTGEPVAA